jgi:hypothetical protein
MNEKEFLELLDSNQDEIWMNIVGYEGLYWISNMGRIISKRVSIYAFRKQTLRKDGYLEIKLCSNYKSKSFLVHRIVVSHFVAKHTDKLNATNHINNIRTDNRSCNLEVCDYAYNNKYAYDNGSKKPVSMIGINNPRSLPIIQIDLLGNYVSEFISIKEAMGKFNIKGGFRIYKIGEKICASKGQIFMLKSDYQKIKKEDGSIILPKFRISITNKRTMINTKELKKVVQLDENGNAIEVFDSFKLAEAKIGKKGVIDVCRKRISIDKKGYKRIYKSCGGYQWMYYKDYILQKNK